MTKENNKFAVELCKEFYRAIDKKVTPALMRQWIGQFKNLLNVYTLEELESVIKYIAEGNVRNIYSPGYLSYATNKILDEIRLKEVKNQVPKSDFGVKTFNVDNDVKPIRKSSFLDKFM